jgi:hypothetical protein
MRHGVFAVSLVLDSSEAERRPGRVTHPVRRNFFWNHRNWAPHFRTTFQQLPLLRRLGMLRRLRSLLQLLLLLLVLLL